MLDNVDWNRLVVDVVAVEEVLRVESPVSSGLSVWLDDCKVAFAVAIF